MKYDKADFRLQQSAVVTQQLRPSTRNLSLKHCIVFIIMLLVDRKTPGQHSQFSEASLQPGVDHSFHHFGQNVHLLRL